MADTSTFARLQHTPESLTQFLGVNLRKDRLSLRDEDCARAINADFHTKVGSALLRKGRTLIEDGYGGAVRTLFTTPRSRWVVAGTTLYKNTTAFIQNLDSSYRTALVSMRPYRDTNTWTFIADPSTMRKEDSNGNLHNWGIAAPTVAATTAEGSVNAAFSGIYTFVWTYVRSNGVTVYHESSPSPTSSPRTVSGHEINLTGMTATTDPQVTHKRIYRTVNGGSVHLFDQMITNATTTATISAADTALGSAVETDNDIPPESFAAVRHQEHVFLLEEDNPDYLWWTKRFRPEAVPATNFIRIGTTDDPLTALVSMVGLLGVFTRNTKYRVLGNATSGFVHQEALSSRGTPAPQACVGTERGCFFPAKDGLFLTNFVSEDEELSGLIAPIFEGDTVNDYLPIDFTYASTMSVAYWKQRLYFSYPTSGSTSSDMLAVYSFHTKNWYFYSMGLRSLYVEESNDYLLGGTDGGEIYRLESGVSDNGSPIQLTLEPATRFYQNSFLKKRFDYVRIRATIPSGTLYCDLYIDDTFVTRLAIQSGTRTQLTRLRGVEGYEWRMVCTYSGAPSSQMSIDGIELQAIPLRAA